MKVCAKKTVKVSRM